MKLLMMFPTWRSIMIDTLWRGHMRTAAHFARAIAEGYFFYWRVFIRPRWYKRMGLT